MTPARHRHLRRLVCSVLDNQPAAKPAQVLYFVICQFKDGRASVERDVTHMDHDTTVNQIADGNLSDVVMVIETEFTPHGLDGHMHSRDVTECILAEAAQIRAERLDEPLMSKFDRLIAKFDHDRKLRQEAS